VPNPEPVRKSLGSQNEPKQSLELEHGRFACEDQIAQKSGRQDRFEVESEFPNREWMEE
jgi:hypothetical protein